MREQVIRLLRKGWITQTEAAKLAGTSRQRIFQWARAAGIRPVETRKQYLRGLLK